MAGIFKANNPFNTFLLFVYGIALRIPWIIRPQSPSINRFDGFLYKACFADILLLKDKSELGCFFIIYLLLFTQAVIFNRIVMHQRLFQKANYLPAMSYLLISALFSPWNVLSSVLIVNTLLIWSFSKLNKLYNTHEPRILLYNIGFIISFCSFIYFPAIIFSLLIAFSLTISRPVNLKEWTVGLLGLLSPYYLLFFKYFLIDNDLRYYRFPLLKPMLAILNWTKVEWALVSFLTVLALTGGYFIIITLRKQVVQVRKSWAILALYLVVALLISLLFSGRSLQYALLALVPLSAGVAGFFYYPRVRPILIVAHWLLVAFIVYNGFFIK